MLIRFLRQRKHSRGSIDHFTGSLLYVIIIYMYMAHPGTVKRNRKLVNEADVLTHNAWDDTEWTEQMLEEAEKRIQKQIDDSKTCRNEIGIIEPLVATKWDEFYHAHGDKFFKDRRWIFSEFQEILPFLDSGSPSCSVLEIGCGVGNAVSHLIRSNKNSKLQIYCVDLSSNAIENLKKRDFYLSNTSNITAFCANIVSDFEKCISCRIPPASLDFITIIFTLSSLKPECMQQTLINISTLLKPGGMIFFRDYAKYDLTQLRFKGKSYLSENYYVRADGTTSYFFTSDLVHELFTKAGLSEVELKNDNRLLVNRRKSLKMCRCWIQAKYKKDKST